MKKILVLIITLFTLTVTSQISSNAWQRPTKIFYNQWNGTRTDYVQIIIDLNLDSNNCSFISTGVAIYEGYNAVTNDYLFKRISTFSGLELLNTSSFLDQITISRDTLEPVWTLDKVNYSTTSQANSLYKSISYTPTLSITSNSLSAGGNTITLPASTTSVVASTGISVSSGSVITNTAPMVTQTLTGINGITIVSSANIFTISKTKRQEVYSVTTNSLGIGTGTFSTSYSVAPNIQANIVGGSSNQVITMTVTTTGFTATVVQRSAVTILGIEVLLATANNVNNSNVDILITEK